MNILILSEGNLSPSSGGTERVTCNLIKELEIKGYNFYNFVVNDNYDENIDKLNKCVVEKKIDFILSPFLYSDKIIKLMELIDNSIKIISILHFSPEYAVKGLKSFSYIKHESLLKEVLKNIFYILNYKIKKKQLKKKYTSILKYSDKLVILSEGFKEELNKIVGELDYRNIKVIPNFLPNEFNYTDLNLKKEKNIIFVGRIQYGIKRLDRLLKIWEEIYEDYIDWKLNIVGDGPFLNEIKNYVKKNNLKNVNFLGNCNPENEYKKAEIICLVSDTEGMPMVILEASNYGCIPVTFESSAGIKDMIIDGKDGFIIENFDMNKYEYTLRELMDNHDKREIIRKESLKINNKFNKSKIIDEWIDLFEGLKKINA